VIERVKKAVTCTGVISAAPQSLCLGHIETINYCTLYST